VIQKNKTQIAIIGAEVTAGVMVEAAIFLPISDK
jgi:hypothetical protein